MACINKWPDITKASLLASNTLLPAFAAAKVGTKPAAPTMAAITVSQPESVTAVTNASGPYKTCVRIFFSSSNAVKRAAPCASPITARAGENSIHCFANSSTCLLAVKANTLKRSGCARMTSKVLTPIDPVDPRIEMCLIMLTPVPRVELQLACLELKHRHDRARLHAQVTSDYYP